MTAHDVIAEGEGRFEAHEHRDVALGLARIADTIEHSGDLSSDQLWARLHATLGWLQRDLHPHLAWEDRWLYPELDGLAGTPWATKSARFEHRQIETLIAALEVDSARWLAHATPRRDTEVIAHLSAIRAVIAAHVEREERLLLPLLDETVSVPG
ncbi:MAG: hemerythrin domain-containing protein [Thermomicrobiales bacterium]|jgi:iron-sulfur cluster repair protein YtfE (RIC family)|nr:MAG: hemerythrin domain-containing protein [Thermomicrobiales bacterium]